MINSGLKYVNKRIEICEDSISIDLMNRQGVSTLMPTLMDLSSVNQILSTLTFNAIRPATRKIIDDEKLEEIARAHEASLATEEESIQSKKIPSFNRHYSFLSLQQDKNNKIVLQNTGSETPTAEIDGQQNRSRKNSKKSENRFPKRPISSYGTNKKEDKFGEKYNNRIGSSSSSRMNMFNPEKKDSSRFNSFVNSKSKGRFTPKSNDKSGDVQNSFTQESKKNYKSSMSFIANDAVANNITGGKAGTSVTGEHPVEKIDEEEEKRLIHDFPMRKRVFLHVAQTSSSVQVAWSHSTKNVTGKRVQYILEYGVGIKMSGQEQFRVIYKGKAHKCIITDLMPRTAYRFKVVPFQIDEEGKEVLGETSDIKQINTYDYQDVNPVTLGHHATMIMKKQEKWINFEKQGLILSNYGYSYGIQMWKITIS